MNGERDRIACEPWRQPSAIPDAHPTGRSFPLKPGALLRQIGRGIVEALSTQVSEQTVTIMFTDVEGFTTLTEGWSPHAIAALLDRHFALLTEAVDAEGGIVDKFMGDGMLAYWPARRLRDHRHAATRAALRMAAAMDVENERLIESGAPPLRLRVGLHAGAVVLGSIGGPWRRNLTILGEAVNVAHRIEQLGRSEAFQSSGAQILASADVAERAAPCAQARHLGRYALRGLGEPIDVFRLAPAQI